jgi:hypothetical protein
MKISLFISCGFALSIRILKVFCRASPDSLTWDSSGEILKTAEQIPSIKKRQLVFRSRIGRIRFSLREKGWRF